MRKFIRLFCTSLCLDERGATAIEYALLAMLVAMAIFASAGAIGATLRGVFSNPELLGALSG
jgi:pilus assembly protein Flp/PilA